MDQATKNAFAKLTTTVERQSDALVALSKTVERGFAAVAEDIAAVRREMATKGELAEFRAEMRDGFASIRAELRDIRQRLEALEEAARNSAELTKEIDHLMERVRAIEKRLGIETDRRHRHWPRRHLHPHRVRRARSTTAAASASR